MTAQETVDSIEQDIQRMRIDDALKASLVTRLDEVRCALRRPNPASGAPCPNNHKPFA
jgi:hypothetical protein